MTPTINPDTGWPYCPECSDAPAFARCPECGMIPLGVLHDLCREPMVEVEHIAPGRVAA